MTPSFIGFNLEFNLIWAFELLTNLCLSLISLSLSLFDFFFPAPISSSILEYLSLIKKMNKISHLSEALLVQILSLLPTKDVSVLTKRWKHIWKMVPKLNFDYHLNQSQHETFSENVCRLLLSHKSSIPESLSLRFSLDSCDGMDIGMWIGIAYGHHVHQRWLHFLVPVLSSIS